VRTDHGESGSLGWQDLTAKKGRSHFPVQRLVADCGRRCLPRPGDRVDGLRVRDSGWQVRESSWHQSPAPPKSRHDAATRAQNRGGSNFPGPSS
jgi:hypothetical protein